MHHHLSVTSSKAFSPPGARYWPFGLRTSIALSRRSKTDTLEKRMALALRFLQTRRRRPCKERYRRTRFCGRKTFVHRVVMELILARPLRTDEHVHHVDGNTRNNLPSNLQLLSAGEHAHRTNALYPVIRACDGCGRLYAPPLKTRCRSRFCCRRCYFDSVRRPRGPGPRPQVRPPPQAVPIQ